MSETREKKKTTAKMSASYWWSGKDKGWENDESTEYNFSWI